MQIKQHDVRNPVNIQLTQVNIIIFFYLLFFYFFLFLNFT